MTTYAILSTVVFFCAAFWLGVLAGRWMLARKINCGAVFPQLGRRGIRGWFVGQWYRVIRFKPDYRMAPFRTDLKTGEMYQALPGKGTEPMEGWGPPMCASPEQRERAHTLAVANRQAVGSRIGPDYSNLTDEELEERAKGARLGDGLTAELAWRRYRKQQEPSDGGAA